MARAIIDDGYTIPVTIPASNRYPETSIVYRPPTTRELRKIDAAMKCDDVDAAVTASVEYVAAHLSSWDIATAAGPMPISVATVERLEPVLFAVIFNLTRGLYPDGLPKPEAAEETQPGN